MSVTRTVVPGDWYGVLGASVIVLLPPTAKSRVAGLWETVDDGAGFDEVLDALIRGGLRELPGFVLVSGEGHDVKVVIRGAGSAELDTLDGPVSVSGSEDTTWVEQNIRGVTGLRVQVAQGSGAAYTVETGLVRVASVEHPAGGGTAGVPDADAVAVPVSAPVEPPEGRRRILPPDPQLETPEPPAPEPRILPPDPQLETPEPPAARASPRADSRANSRACCPVAVRRSDAGSARPRSWALGRALVRPPHQPRPGRDPRCPHGNPGGRGRSA